MTNTIGTSSALLIRIAQADARRNVSRLCWCVLGICLGFLPFINVLAFSVAIVIMCLLVPKIDLSTPERVEIYSQDPALYTEQYRKTVKKLRFMNILSGWIIGIIIFNPI